MFYFCDWCLLQNLVHMAVFSQTNMVPFWYFASKIQLGAGASDSATGGIDLQLPTLLNGLTEVVCFDSIYILSRFVLVHYDQICPLCVCFNKAHRGPLL